MALRLFNTLTGKVEPFVPLDDQRVTFYSCGPTVYDYAHVGNFRSFLTADVLRRWLESPLCARVDSAGRATGAGGYRVRQVMNMTDVGHMLEEDSAAGAEGEDRMESARRRLLEDKKSGRLPPGAPATFDPNDPNAVADFYAHAFVEDSLVLGLRVVEESQRDPSLMPRPTRFIRPMLEMILTLLELGHAYSAPDGAVYFDTQTFPEYGRLSGNTPDKTLAGAGGRVSAATQRQKKHPADFLLWKADRSHLMRWDPAKEFAGDAARRALAARFSLREGYPGWHVECSAMAAGLLGRMIDLHSGGEDNIFPHHECEIAQSRCAFGTPAFARTWVHTRYLMVEGAKMSKSRGNFFTLRDVLDRGFEPGAIRLELIRTHYRSNSNFTEQGLRDSGRIIERWRRFLERAEGSASQDGARDAARAEAQSAFAGAMDDDLNVSGAIGSINAWINRVESPSRADAEALRRMDETLGVLSRGAATPARGGGEEDREIDDLVRRRTEARASKNWAEADRIRQELARLNVEVTDTPQGAKWSRRIGL